MQKKPKIKEMSKPSITINARDKMNLGKVNKFVNIDWFWIISQHEQWSLVFLILQPESFKNENGHTLTN